MASRNSRGYIVGASIDSGDPVWEFQTDVDAAGQRDERRVRKCMVVRHGAAQLGYVVFDTADCDFTNAMPLSVAIVALHISDGHLAWVYRPRISDFACDWDFGGSVNAGITPGARPRSSERAARTGPTIRWTRRPVSFDGPPTSSSAASQAASSARPPSTASGSTEPRP